MLKIRLMGTRTDISWFHNILKKIKGIQILSNSEPLENKGTNKYCRMYVEIEKKDKENN